MEEKDIELEDLIYLEEDLSRDELISVLFLLYGCEKPEWILTKLKNKDKNLLYDYGTHHLNWKTSIVEALTIAKIFEVVEFLGITSSEAREQFSRNSVTNPGLKVLYQLCEACKKETTDSLTSHIKSYSVDAKKSNEQLLEVYLLYSIANGLIKVTSNFDDCDFSFLTNFFSNQKFEEVESVVKNFPRKLNFSDSTNNNFTSRAVNLVRPTTSKGSSDVYPAKKMQVLIINQQSFIRDSNPELQNLLPDEDLNERKGTSKDKEALQLLFESFGYPVTARTNLNHREVLQEVEKASKKASICDGLIVCVLSHGHEGVVYGHNSVPVRVKDIKSTMAAKALLGKTKILLIQACQGESFQKPVKKIVSKIEFDGPRASNFTSGSVFADFLIFWSTIEGFASVRHIDNGTWFIQEVVKKIREMNKNHHLLDICTSVIKEVSLKRGDRDEFMLPKLEATFTRCFYFPELSNSSSC